MGNCLKHCPKNDYVILLFCSSPFLNLASTMFLFRITVVLSEYLISACFYSYLMRAKFGTHQLHVVISIKIVSAQ